MDSLAKMSQKIFLNILFFQDIKLNKKINKKLAFLAAGRATPPPFTLAEAFAKNASFFTCSL